MKNSQKTNTGFACCCNINFVTHRTKTNRQYLENMSVSINRWDSLVEFLYQGSTAAVGLSFPYCWGVEITFRHITIAKVFPGQVIRPKQSPLITCTQHSQKTDLHAPVGIRTGNPSKQAAAGPYLRLSGHRYRPFVTNIEVQQRH